MSGNAMGLLHQQIARGDFEEALQNAPHISNAKPATFSDWIGLIQHALNARQAELAVVLLEESRRFFVSADIATGRQIVEEVTTLLAACWREKMEAPARKAISLTLELLELPNGPVRKPDQPVVVHFAGLAGRFALRQNDEVWFGQIAVCTAAWAARELGGQDGEGFLEAFDTWLHRILRNDRAHAIPALFEAFAILYAAETDKEIFASEFLKEWRAVAASACLNPISPVASELVEQLLLFTIRTGDAKLWSPVTERISEVAALAVAKHGVMGAFPVFRPMLDVARVNLGDELKFGTGPDSDSMRQRIIRLVCAETIWIADMAAHSDFGTVAGDKIEEMYQSWIKDPRYEPHIRSIQRFCQLLLIYWANNRKRAARKWTPREKNLSDLLLLKDEDHAKLVFLR
jgi:hypothetical protein